MAGTNLIAHNDRLGSIHHFIDHEPPGFKNRGQHKQIAETVEGRQFSLIAKTKEADLTGSHLLSQLFQCGTQLPFPHHEQHQRASLRIHLSHGTNQGGGIFDIDEFGTEEDDAAPLLNAKFRTKFFTQRRRLLAALLEKGVVHSIGSQVNTFLRNTVRAVVVSIGRADGQKPRHAAKQHRKEQTMCQSKKSASMLVILKSLTTHQYWQVQQACRTQGSQRISIAPAVHPHNVWLNVFQCSRERGTVTAKRFQAGRQRIAGE